MIRLTTLIKDYDCIAWIPTIRGDHALSLIENTNFIFGDVDKYAIDVKSYDGFVSEHRVIASSLHTVTDTKNGPDYIRTFRYIFYGHTTSDTSSADYGYLKGRLVILARDTAYLTEKEQNLLEGLKALSKMKADYNLDVYNSAGMETLNDGRKDMVKKYKSCEEILHQIEEIPCEDAESRYTFLFDICMSQDGILLIKDSSLPGYKDMYAQEGSLYDYHIHVPLHRIFKQAMNYVKSLLHTNYHHNLHHDTLLPASNLHPCHAKGDYERIFHHQLEALVTPLLEMKRGGFKDCSIEPEGVLGYAQAMIYAFRRNGLISKELADEKLAYIKLQKDEVDLMTRTKKSVISALASEHGRLVCLTGALAMVVSLYKIASLIVKWPVVKILSVYPFQLAIEDEFDYSISPNSLFLIYWGIFVSLMVVSYLIFWIPRKRAKEKKFRKDGGARHAFRTKLCKILLFKDSGKELSRRYRLWIMITDWGKKEVALCVLWGLYFSCCCYSLYKIVVYLI